MPWAEGGVAAGGKVTGKAVVRPTSLALLAAKAQERAAGQGMRAASRSQKRHGNPKNPQSKRSPTTTLVLAAEIRWASDFF